MLLNLITRLSYARPEYEQPTKQDAMMKLQAALIGDDEQRRSEPGYDPVNTDLMNAKTKNIRFSH